jgi:serine/threonine-protein kinase
MPNVRTGGQPAFTGSTKSMAQSQTILCPICHQENTFGANFCMHCGANIILNDDQPSDEKRYFITRVIKQGGQGSVYEGIDQQGQVYAIKEMLDRFTDPQERAEATRRFNAEATILQKLRHPRIPRVYSHFTDEGRHYLTMDFVRGDDLESIIERQQTIPENEMLEWAGQICDVLDYLHKEGLVYRDVKPSNIMIDHADGGVKLVDFGIAKILKPSERGGTQIGTPGYAPPEQYQGLATPASDIYALGATLHHLLTGRDPTEQPPFSFPPAHEVNPNVSRQTSSALQQALKMKPEERFATVRGFRAALLPAPGEQPTQVRVAAPPSVPPMYPGAASASASAARPAASSQPVPQAAPTPQPRQPRQPASRPQPAVQPVPRQQPISQPWVGRFIGFLHGYIVVMVVLALTAGVGAFLWLFNAGNTAQPQNEPGAFVLVRPTLEVEATLPADASDDAIQNALRAAYIAEVEQRYEDARINGINEVTITRIGEWEVVGQEGDQVRYRATMQGFVSIPAQNP